MKKVSEQKKKMLNKRLWEGSVNQDIFRDPGNRMVAPLSSRVCGSGPRLWDIIACFYTLLLCASVCPLEMGVIDFTYGLSHED